MLIEVDMSSDTLPRQGRRQFQGTLDAAPAAAAVGPKATAFTAAAEDARERSDTRPDRFGRLFNLPPFAEPTAAVPNLAALARFAASRWCPRKLAW